ncbi:hypothetical protein SELMODRAFT_182435 [Selaginella moellendorffii]|uniref:Enoyl reductase (ER) domain-containing protein n=1 Tax=Selaginella moellendorffii TaxID=88036 RepID=D8ST74_SELML|nr:uncharacterized protein LOC9659342 [Selaginella moellendorffii]EFJ12439.1 hypothetical protein SELMODRAFT_182435 [Selaginella moellendorffii]|eukprot:XP_002986582.1 uncharacterized protein LOC9659342 [Selaginella moellendorffii]
MLQGRQGFRSLLLRLSNFQGCRYESGSAVAAPTLAPSPSLDGREFTAAGTASTMRAAVLWEPGKPMTLEDMQMPRPKFGEVLLKTKACGVCHSDLHIIKKDQPFPLPVVLGHEVTGEIVEHGPHTDAATLQRLPIGARAVGAFIMPCGGCFYCVKGQEDLCETFFKYSRGKGALYDGQTRLFIASNGKPIHMYSMGGMAEYCVVPSNALAVLPSTLPYSDAAIMGCAVFTAYGAVKNAANLRAGETVSVIGIGGVGSSCLQLARAFGARQVIAVDVDDKKLENSKKFGATHTVNSAKVNPVEAIKELTGGRGVDVAIEALGKPKTFQQTAMSVRDGGRAVMVGLASFGTTAEFDMVHVVRRQVRIIGSYGARARQDLPELVTLAEIGAINLSSGVTQRCGLEEVNQTFDALDRGQILGRAIVEFN